MAPRLRERQALVLGRDADRGKQLSGAEAREQRAAAYDHDVEHERGLCDQQQAQDQGRAAGERSAKAGVWRPGPRAQGRQAGHGGIRAQDVR